MGNAQCLNEGDMLDRKSGDGYSHGMLYLGTSEETKVLVKKYCPSHLRQKILQSIDNDGWYVIDFGPTGTMKGNGGGADYWSNGVKIKKVNLYDGEFKRKEYRTFVGTALSVEETIKRAFSKLDKLCGAGHDGYREYDFMGNNCHHFVAWCKYGDAKVADKVALTMTAGRVRRDIKFEN